MASNGAGTRGPDDLYAELGRNSLIFIFGRVKVKTTIRCFRGNKPIFHHTHIGCTRIKNYTNYTDACKALALFKLGLAFIASQNAANVLFKTGFSSVKGLNTKDKKSSGKINSFPICFSTFLMAVSPLSEWLPPASFTR